MSTCPNKELFSAYIDDEVGSPWKEMLDAHLEECSECRKVYTQYQSLHLTFQKEAAVGVHDFDCARFFETISDKRAAVIGKHTEKKYSFRPAKVISIAAAAAVLVLCTPVLFQLKNNNSPFSVKNSFEPMFPVSQPSQLSALLSGGLHSNDMNSFVFSTGSAARKGKVFAVNDFGRLYSCGGFASSSFDVDENDIYLSGYFLLSRGGNKLIFDISNEKLRMSLSDVALLYNQQLKRMHSQNMMGDWQ